MNKDPNHNSLVNRLLVSFSVKSFLRFKYACPGVKTIIQNNQTIKEVRVAVADR